MNESVVKTFLLYSLDKLTNNVKYETYEKASRKTFMSLFPTLELRMF